MLTHCRGKTGVQRLLLYPSDYLTHLFPKYIFLLDKGSRPLLGGSLADVISVTHAGLGQEEFLEILERGVGREEKKIL